MNKFTIYAGVKMTPQSLKELASVIYDHLRLDDEFKHLISPQKPLILKSVKNLPKKHKRKNDWWEDWLQIQINICPEGEKKTQEKLKRQGARIPEAYLNHCKYKLEEIIRHVFTAASIAFPGEFDFAKSVVLYNSTRLEPFRAVLSYFSDFEGPNWPRMENISIKQAVDWSYAQEGFLQGITTTPVGRALASFSHLFFESYIDHEELTLVWALRGLEAIYTSGKGGNLESKQQQLVQKSILFLTQPPQNINYEKKIKEMYDYRSRFLHGNMNGASKTVETTDEYWDEHYDINRIDHILLALYMLVVTLQKCVKNNINTIDFAWSLLLNKQE